MNQLIHTPAGVRDVFGDELEKKIVLMNRIDSLFESYGYRPIQTPSMEYYPVFDKDKGTIHSSMLFKMIDKEGHTLIMRPDFTPSIARAVSMYFPLEKMPLRLSYKGSVFLNNSNYRGRLNESTEMGAELINHDDLEADAEIISLSAEIMKAAGLKEFQISIGNVRIFNALAADAGISKEKRDEIRHLLSVRNQYGATELIENLDIEIKYKNALKKLPELFGSEDVFERASAIALNPECISAIDRLRLLYKLLSDYGYGKYISFDLGMVSDFSYYTGIIFQAITYGTGDAVIKGGRYNRFMEKFGKEAYAIGFTTLVDSLLLAIERQNIQIEIKNDRIMILYSRSVFEKAVSMSAKLRSEGKSVFTVPEKENNSLSDYISFAERSNCGRIIIIDVCGNITDKIIMKEE